MNDIKRECGLTNYDIAVGINKLSDTDFYEVFYELARLHNICIEKQSFGSLLDNVLHEIAIKD